MSKVYNLKKKYENEVKKDLLKKFDHLNVMSIPKIEKIVINRGLGEAVSNSKVVELTIDQFLRITGQKPVPTKSKKSISNFKVREGQVIGCKITLRSKKMYDFITKLINISIPKIRDFRGLPKKSFDGRGNYTLGIKEESIFPEINVDNIDKPRGFDICFITSTDKDEEAYALLELLGFPFRKN
ncbi:50S ribosomal protein L5 [Candidatus Marinamargulisbacteria bacterium SCGC AAA071-K20]|nr:50S ribosomal protein L5 [Candidatus Marinamargulisbacteria bacterium SCGC AAA071-K20]